MSMTSVRMPDELMERLTRAAERLRRSKGWIIKDAVREYVEREERKAQMLEQTREALADVEAGRVVDSREAMAWLESWGTPEEKEPPR